jgi:flagellar basal-body rod protein FlgB
VISNNIANVDTPFFKRSEVKFEDLLRNEMEGTPSLQGYRTDTRHFVIGGPSEPVAQVEVDKNSVMNNNLNNVDIDTEMTELAKNQLRYNVAVQQISNNLRALRTAIDGGK